MNKINLLELAEPPPDIDEVAHDACIKATDKDFDLAKHIRPDLHFSESERRYTDKEFGYLCLNLKVKRIRLGGGFVEQPVWYRISGSWQSGGHWEPDTYEEYVVDQIAGFRSLADACIQSALDSLENGLVETHNTCPQCYGASEEYDGVLICPKCKGKGYIPLCVPPVRIVSDEDLNKVRDARAKFQYLFDEFTPVACTEHWPYHKEFLSKLLSAIPDNNQTNN